MHIILAPVIVINALWLALAPVASDPPVVEKYLTEGKLVEGEKALADAVKANPTDSQSRFELGTLQFLRGREAGPVVSPLRHAQHRAGWHAAVCTAAHPAQQCARADSLQRPARTDADLER